MPPITKSDVDYVLNPPRPTKVWGGAYLFPSMLPQQPRSGTMIEYPLSYQGGDVLNPGIVPGVTMTETGTRNIADMRATGITNYVPNAEIIRKQHADLRAKAIDDPRWQNTVDKLYGWFQLDTHHWGLPDDSDVDYETNFAYLLSDRLKRMDDYSRKSVNTEAFGLQQIIESGSAANYIKNNILRFSPGRINFNNEYEIQHYIEVYEWFKDYYGEFPPPSRNDRVLMYHYTSYALTMIPDEVDNIIAADESARTWRRVIASFNGEQVRRREALAAYYLETTSTTAQSVLDFFGQNQMPSTPMLS